MNKLTIFGLFSVTAGLILYAFEYRNHWFILAFSISCILASIYGFLQGAWPFGLAEVAWAVVAFQRWLTRYRRNLNNTAIILSAVILLTFTQLSYAGNSITVNVPNSQGGYTAIVMQQSGSGYTGPQGEFYAQFPSVAQLQAVYGLGTLNVGSNISQEIAVTIAPPALPVYVQPEPPAPDYIWAPGYWAYDSFFEDYYWVPGTWVTAPRHDYLWTPGYWYWGGGHFIFSEGYWGPHVGFYGGINYGYGYGGRGFSGGYWNNGVFVRKTVNITNVTNITINNTTSFNGGPGGIKAQPTSEERAAMKEKHTSATAQQKLQVQSARKNPALRASMNHGKPAIAATAKPGIFKGKGVVAARHSGAFYNKTDAAARHAAATHHTKPKPRPKAKKPKPKIYPPNGDNTP